ncbi:MAG: hypothetical protein H6832_01890 [Planctomycetes bacterium]|nr:hypothetical protein [Planctomycetota bacterium]
MVDSLASIPAALTQQVRPDSGGSHAKAGGHDTRAFDGSLDASTLDAGAPRTEEGERPSTEPHESDGAREQLAPSKGLLRILPRAPNADGKGLKLDVLA